MAQKKPVSKGAGSNKPPAGKSSGASKGKSMPTGRYRIPPNPPGSGRKSRHGRGRGGRPY